MSGPSPAVIGHIQGGLGNQLFCYAAARALSLRAGLPLRLNTQSGYRNEKYRRACLLHHFQIDADEASASEAYRGLLGRSRRSRQIKRDAKRPVMQRTILREPADQAFIPELFVLRPTTGVYLLGYWQDERYFVDAREALLSELTPRDDAPFAPDPELEALTGQGDCVSVHLRSYAEVKDPAPGLVLDASYYGPALDAIVSKLPSARLLVFSDSTDWARQIIDQAGHTARATFAPPASTDGTTATLTDFALMTRCRHHVVGNSSFSWWTAWLGERAGSHIVAPPTGLPGHGRGFPDRWLTLPHHPTP